MKPCLLLIVALFSFNVGHAQNTLGSVDDGNVKWIKLGVLSIPQGGNDCFIRIIGGAGYNAHPYQQGNVELHIRTSNGMSWDANGFAFAATAASYGRGTFISQFRIVPDQPGVNATAYTIYAYCGAYPGNTFFTVECPNGSWTTAVSAVGGDPGGYNVSFEYFVNNDSFINGKLAINTADPKGYQLAVNGSAIATSMTVKLNANWPDYVFKASYQLRPLSDLKSYINQNHHLPDMPSEEEVKDNGIDLGEMVKLQTKKIEELTLYLIEKDSQFRAQEEVNKSQQKEIESEKRKITELEAKLNKLLEISSRKE